MDVRKRRIEIFKQVQDGRLTLEEASRLLEAVDNSHEPERIERTVAAEPPAPVATSTPNPAPEPVRPSEPLDPPAADLLPPLTPQPGSSSSEPPLVPTEVDHPRPKSPIWGGWWLLVFVPGLLLIAAAANWMYEAFLAARLGWGFWLSFIPFFLGIVLVWLGWEIRMARWLYVHIRQRPGARPRELMLSVPLPGGWVSWAIRQFGRFGPHLRGSDVSDLVEEIDQAVATDGPLQISVEDRHGGQIEIWMDGPKGSTRRKS